MKTVSSYEAKTRKILDEVAKSEKQKMTPQEAIAKLKELRKGITLGRISWKKLITEGRR